MASRNAAPLHLRIVGNSPAVLWGLSSVERLHRQVRGTGVQLDFDSPARPGDTFLLLRADYLYDQRIIGKLVELRNVVLRSREGDAAVAAHVESHFAAPAEALLTVERPDTESLPLRHVTVDTLVDSYVAELLKSETALLLPVRSERRQDLEQRLFDDSYKGITDVVTKYVWPKPAFWMTRFCVAAGIRPNHVTATSIVLACVVTALFAVGWLATGLILAWTMTFLDTVDGKLARVTVDSSDLGHFMDKILDIIHPPLWYIAWGFGLASSATPLAPGDLSRVVVAILAGYVGERLAEVLFRRVIGGFSIFSWRPFDSRFRLVLARRNPCLLILTASWLVGRPDYGVIGVALWLIASAAILIARVLQAAYERLAVGPLQPWLRAGS